MLIQAGCKCSQFSVDIRTVIEHVPKKNLHMLFSHFCVFTSGANGPNNPHKGFQNFDGIYILTEAQASFIVGLPISAATWRIGLSKNDRPFIQQPLYCHAIVQVHLAVAISPVAAEALYLHFFLHGHWQAMKSSPQAATAAASPALIRPCSTRPGGAIVFDHHGVRQRIRLDFGDEGFKNGNTWAPWLEVWRRSF